MYIDLSSLTELNQERSLPLSSISRKQWSLTQITIWRHDFMVNDVTYALYVNISIINDN